MQIELLIEDDAINCKDAESIWIALSDGSLSDLTSGVIRYQCDYLMPYYGVAVVLKDSGDSVICPFHINPAWKPEWASEIQANSPDLVFPETDCTALHKVLVDWWNTVVIADLRSSRGIELEPVDY